MTLNIVIFSDGESTCQMECENVYADDKLSKNGCNKACDFVKLEHMELSKCKEKCQSPETYDNQKHLDKKKDACDKSCSRIFGMN